MNKFKTKIAVLAISFLSFAGIQSASAIEGFSIGAAMNVSGFGGTGTETKDVAGTNEIVSEHGVFEADYASVFIEYAASDVVSVGIERNLDDITTPTNLNSKNNTDNSVKATFKDHTTFYANINMPFNTYFKLGYSIVDVATQESLGTGGSYDDVDTTGMTVGLGFNLNTSNGVFVRTEISGTQYDDVTATNKSPDGNAQVIDVTDMIGVTATLRVGKTF
tara:strand:- start:391 stop:1050 length:660 start_codon:yes stop_codon:yes gene_type:complete